jgi:SLA1 homology domain 1, SHD1
MIHKSHYLVLFVTFFSLLPFLSDDLNSQRTWNDQSGKHSFEATLLEVTETHAKLKASDGKEISVPVARLSNSDQKLVEAVRHCEISHGHVGALNQLEQKLVDKTSDAVKEIDELQKKSGGGFAAGLYSSTFKACMGGEAQLDQARRQLDDTIKRIRIVREAFPEMHKKTLASALNNRAIISVRDNKPTGAVSNLQDASELFDETPRVLYHNIKMLSQVASKSGQSFLGKGDQKRLATLVARPHEGDSQSLPSRYMYTLEHDPFLSLLAPGKNSANQTSTNVSLQSLGLIGSLWQNRILPELTCLQCNGKGFLRCPGCSRGVVTEKVQVFAGRNQKGEDLYTTKFKTTECPRCNGKGGFDCRSCVDGRLTLGK